MCRAPRSTIAGRERHGCTHHRRAASWAATGMSDPRVIPFPVAHTKVSGPGGPSLISPLRPHRTERVHPPVYATPDSPARGGDVTSRAGEKRGARAMGARGRASVGRAFGSVERGGAVNPGGRAVPFLSPHATIWFLPPGTGGAVRLESRARPSARWPVRARQTAPQPLPLPASRASVNSRTRAGQGARSTGRPPALQGPLLAKGPGWAPYEGAKRRRGRSACPRRPRPS